MVTPDVGGRNRGVLDRTSIRNCYKPRASARTMLHAKTHPPLAALATSIRCLSGREGHQNGHEPQLPQGSETMVGWKLERLIPGSTQGGAFSLTSLFIQLID